jgi:hypothetical protein
MGTLMRQATTISTMHDEACCMLPGSSSCRHHVPTIPSARVAANSVCITLPLVQRGCRHVCGGPWALQSEMTASSRRQNEQVYLPRVPESIVGGVEIVRVDHLQGTRHVHAYLCCMPASVRFVNNTSGLCMSWVVWWRCHEGRCLLRRLTQSVYHGVRRHFNSSAAIGIGEMMEWV